MPYRYRRLILCAGAASLGVALCSAAPIGTSVTYQGSLKQNGTTINGTVNLDFSLWDSAGTGSPPSGGTQIGGTQTINNVPVTNGSFMVTLNDAVQFGATAFNGSARYLQIAVNGQTLSPRQTLSNVPNALFASNAPWQLNGTTMYYNAGTVGLGTSTPGGRLEIAGVADKQIRLRGGDFGASILDLSASGPGAGWYGALQASNDANGFAGFTPLLLNPNGGDVYVGSSVTSGALNLRGLNDALKLIPTLMSGGQSTGIEFADPDNGTAPVRLEYFDNGIPALCLTGGRFGIGTTTPGAVLDVNGTAKFTDFQLGSSTTAGYVLMANASGVGTWQQLPSAGGAATGWFVAGNTVYNANSGNVGIGISAPGQKLEVSSTVSYKTARFSNPNNSQFDAAGIEIFSTSSNKAYNLVSGADGFFYIAQASLPNNGYDTSIRFNSTNGMLSAKQYEIRGGADIAEPFNVNNKQSAGSVQSAAKPGMVVCIDPEHPGELCVATRPYDRTVAGVISGAGGVSPGLQLRQEGTIADGERAVALTGRVYCLVDADAGGPVQPGDLLTTSATPGHAMKVSDRERSSGAVLGKAMTSLKSGQGLVLILVTLQ